MEGVDVGLNSRRPAPDGAKAPGHGINLLSIETLYHLRRRMKGEDMARLNLPPEEWLEMREVLLRVPEQDRDEKWRRSFEAVDAVCGALSCARELFDKPE